MGLLDFDPNGQMTPQQMGLLYAGLGILQNARGRSLGEAIGSGGLEGLQGMQTAQNAAYKQQQAFQQAGLNKLKVQLEQKKLENESNPQVNAEIHSLIPVMNSDGKTANYWRAPKYGKPEDTGLQVPIKNLGIGNFYSPDTGSIAPYPGYIPSISQAAAATERAKQREEITQYQTPSGAPGFAKKGSLIPQAGVQTESSPVTLPGLDGQPTTFRTPAEALDAVRQFPETYPGKQGIIQDLTASQLTGQPAGVGQSTADKIATEQQVKDITTQADKFRDAPAILKASNEALGLIDKAAPFMGPGGSIGLSLAKTGKKYFGYHGADEAINAVTKLKTDLFQPIMTMLKQVDSTPSQMQQIMMMESLGNETQDPDALKGIIASSQRLLQDKLIEHNKAAAQAIGSGIKFPVSPIITLPDSGPSPSLKWPASQKQKSQNSTTILRFDANGQLIK